MLDWLPSARSIVQWLIIIGVIWFIISNPAKAGSDVAHFVHRLTWAFSRLAQFVASL
jgi:hypothetical protein